MADKLIKYGKGQLKMSAKELGQAQPLEKQGRIFPGLPEEDAQIETLVKLTGLTKQDYIIRRLLVGMWWCRAIRRFTKALRDQLSAVLDELRRIEAGQSVSDELLDTIRMITTIMNGMQEEFAYDRWKNDRPGLICWRR